MRTVKVSSKYQIVLPKELRQKLNIKVGATLSAGIINNQIVITPGTPVDLLYGSMKGVWSDPLAGGGQRDVTEVVRESREDPDREDLIERAWQGQ